MMAAIHWSSMSNKQHRLTKSWPHNPHSAKIPANRPASIILIPSTRGLNNSPNSQYFRFVIISTLSTILVTFDLHHDTPEGNTSHKRTSQNSERERRGAGDPGQKHFVETLLTADYSMTSFHGIDPMPTYLLTMLNIVSLEKLVWSFYVSSVFCPSH